jgi:hypothetical protein
LVTWYFDSGNPPFIESKDPTSGATNVDADTLISFDVVDAESYIRISEMDAYINGSDAYRSGIGFVSPFDGPSSSVTLLPGGSIDGYDAYRVIVDYTSNYIAGTYTTVRCRVDDYGWNELDESWTFSIPGWYFETGNPPFIENKNPAAGASGVAVDTLITFDITDAETFVRVSGMDAYVNGLDAYRGSVGFVPPFNGSSSSITFLPGGSSDGYDAYRVVIDSTSDYVAGTMTTVRCRADDYGWNELDEAWTFGDLNTLYFSDGYGLKAIGIGNLVGEGQDVVRVVLDETSSPSIPSNSVTDVFGNFVRDNLHLVLSFDGYKSPTEGYGAIIATDETDLDIYLDGYRTKAGQMNDNGVLYIINKSLNRVEVYYGADFRSGTRSPDFVYSSSSTPSIFGGEILSLHVSSGESLVYSSGTRIYVGTSLGMTRIETYDQESSDGYSASMDSNGTAFTYGIQGSGATFEVVGGTIPRVTDIGSNDESSMILVVTNDGYSGGVTQISLEGNDQVIFMDDSNLLPSGDIRKIFGSDV